MGAATIFPVGVHCKHCELLSLRAPEVGCIRGLQYKRNKGWEDPHHGPLLRKPLHLWAGEGR